MMASAIQKVGDSSIKDSLYSENDAIDALYHELQKGIRSMRDDEIYTVEEAWEEIDKI